MGKKEKRARKKERRQMRPRCDQCGSLAPRGGIPDDGNHDSPISVGNIAWDGLSIVAWCQTCGWEFCS